MKTDRIDKVDMKFVPVDPEDGFDPEHNRQVIKRTIEWTEKMEARKNNEYQDSLRERTSAFAQYANDFEKGRTDTKVEKYFGKEYLTYLRGQQILDKIKKASNA